MVRDDSFLGLDVGVVQRELVIKSGEMAQTAINGTKNPSTSVIEELYK